MGAPYTEVRLIYGEILVVTPFLFILMVLLSHCLGNASVHCIYIYFKQFYPYWMNVTRVPACWLFYCFFFKFYNLWIPNTLSLLFEQCLNTFIKCDWMTYLTDLLSIVRLICRCALYMEKLWKFTIYGGCTLYRGASYRVENMVLSDI